MNQVTSTQANVSDAEIHQLFEVEELEQRLENMWAATINEDGTLDYPR